MWNLGTSLFVWKIHLLDRYLTKVLGNVAFCKYEGLYSNSDIEHKIDIGSMLQQPLCVKYWSFVSFKERTSVQHTFNNSYIYLFLVNSGLTCQVGTNSALAVDTSKLLREYYDLDPRVPVLALGLRYWARLCSVDQQADGSVPAYAYVLMVIHFLQQCEPHVIPVIQEVKREKKLKMRYQVVIIVIEWLHRAFLNPLHNDSEFSFAIAFISRLDLTWVIHILHQELWHWN